MKAGDVVVNKQGSEAVILSCNGWDDVRIKFLDDHGYEARCQVGSIKRGSFKNPYHPRVLGIGYIGVGPFNAGRSSKHTPEYEAWKSMLTRCYAPMFLNKNPTYRGCFVGKDWHNFQNFAEWFSNQVFKGSGYDLDKDLLSGDVKIYSESTCCLIPSALNTFLISDKAKNSDYPAGVSLHSRSATFSARVSVNGVRKNLGFYRTPNEAYRAYVKAKEAYVKEMALEWQERIDARVFNALMKWKVAH